MKIINSFLFILPLFFIYQFYQLEKYQSLQEWKYPAPDFLIQSLHHEGGISTISGTKEGQLFHTVIDKTTLKFANKKIPVVNNFAITAIHQDQESNYLLAGVSNNQQAIQYAKTDSNGRIIWERELPITCYCQINAIKNTSNGGYILAAKKKENILFINIGNRGEIIWQNTMGSYDQDYIYQITETPNNDFIAVGRTADFNSQYLDMWVIQLNGQTGRNIWEKTLGKSNSPNDVAYNITFTKRGQPLILGTQQGHLKLIELKQNQDIAHQWTTSQKNANMSGHMMTYLPDGNLLIVAQSIDKKNKKQLHIIKLTNTKNPVEKTILTKASIKIYQNQNMNPLRVHLNKGIYHLTEETPIEQLYFDIDVEKEKHLYAFSINKNNETNTYHHLLGKKASIENKSLQIQLNHNKKSNLKANMQYFVFFISHQEIPNFNQKINKIKKTPHITWDEYFQNSFKDETFNQIDKQLFTTESISVIGQSKQIIPIIILVNKKH